MSLQVIEVRACRRTGVLSLVSCMRKTMEEHYKEKSVALGGTFIIQKGKAKVHIMVNIQLNKKQNVRFLNVVNKTSYGKWWDGSIRNLVPVLMRVSHVNFPPVHWTQMKMLRTGSDILKSVHRLSVKLSWCPKIRWVSTHTFTSILLHKVILSGICQVFFWLYHIKHFILH